MVATVSVHASPGDARRSPRAVTALLALALAGRSIVSVAQIPPGMAQPGASRAQRVPEPEAAPGSPRTSVRDFLDLARHARHEEAARFLVVPPARAADAPELARQLAIVLERQAWLDVESLSPRQDGDEEDGLGQGVEQVGTIALDGRREPVRLVRVEDAAGARWAFSAATVAHVEAWYSAVAGRWFLEHLPPSLLRAGPLGLAWWQWLALPVAALVAMALGRALATITRGLLVRAASRTRSRWDDALLAGLRGPLAIAWGIVLLRAALPWIGLTAQAHAVVVSLLKGLAIAAIFWAAWRSVEVMAGMLAALPWAARSPSALNLIAVGKHLFRGLVAAMGAIAALAALGLPVTTLLAGVGIGSLAIAFGAQRTVENVFGSIALAVDQPFRVGDTVKVDDFTGVVEDVGLRSTRFRTPDRTLISIPNGRVADMRLESLTARDRMRFTQVVGLAYSTRHDQLLAVVAGFERVLAEHPKAWRDTILVAVKDLGAGSIDVEVTAWFAVTDNDEFGRARQDVLLGFLRVVEEAGTRFAFPTRIVHLVGEPGPEPSGIP